MATCSTLNSGFLRSASMHTRSSTLSMRVFLPRTRSVKSMSEIRGQSGVQSRQNRLIQPSCEEGCCEDPVLVDCGSWWEWNRQLVSNSKARIVCNVIMVVLFFLQSISETKETFKCSVGHEHDCSFRDFQDATCMQSPDGDCSWLPTFGCNPSHF
jgi:hypothetical protein